MSVRCRCLFFFFSSRRRHTRLQGDWSSDVCSSDLATGKLGVMLVGLGAVSTTFIAGVENVRRGRALPIGSLSQMATIRLGKRTDKRAPKIKEFVPLADLKDLVFTAWDPIPDDAFTAALKAGVLDPHEHLDPIKPLLQR